MRLPPALRPLWPYLKVGYTAATRAGAPLTRQLSRARGGWVPRRVIEGPEDATGAHTVTVRPPLSLRRAVPAGSPQHHPVFLAQLAEDVPRVAVAELPGARVLQPHAAVITAEGELVAEFSPYFGTRRPGEHPLFLHPFPPPPLVLDARVAVLATRGDANYYHFLLDVIPKLGLLADSGLAAPERYYAPLGRPFQRDLLALAGVDLDAVIDSAAAPHVQARELVVPGLPDAHLRTPPWSVEFLRSRLLPAGAARGGGRRIYVTRGTARHNRTVRNEDELLTALAALGFETLDPGALPVADQIDRFAGAEAIVAPHGAALANLVFAAPGTRVVELFPPGFVQACYWKIADVVGLDYHYVIGRGRTPRATRLGRPELMRGVASDIDVDPRSVLAALRDLPARAGPSRGLPARPGTSG